MFTAIGQGMLFGIALCFSIGPAFFGLIQTSLKHGYGSGIAMALGIFASDLIYLLLAFFGLSGWLMDEQYAIPVGIVGGLLLIGYGVVQIMKKTVVQNVDGEPIEFKRPTRGASVLKGFLMNMFNPFVIFLWIGAIGLASNKLNNDTALIVTFFVSTLATVLGTDILKSLAAGKIKNYLNEKIIHKVNTIAGIILMVSGVVLIVRVFVEKPSSSLPAERIEMAKTQGTYAQADRKKEGGGAIVFLKNDSVYFEQIDPPLVQSYNGKWSVQNDTLILNLTDFHKNVKIQETTKVNTSWKFVFVNGNFYQVWESQREDRPFLPKK